MYNQCLPWEHMANKSHCHLFEGVSICLKEMLLYRSCSDAFKAQTMKNRLIESSHLRHLRISMKGVAVIAKSVEKGLVWSRLLFFHHISCSFGDGRIDSFDCSFVPEATRTSDKQA